MMSYCLRGGTKMTKLRKKKSARNTIRNRPFRSRRRPSASSAQKPPEMVATSPIKTGKRASPSMRERLRLFRCLNENPSPILTFRALPKRPHPCRIPGCADPPRSGPQ